MEQPNPNPTPPDGASSPKPPGPSRPHAGSTPSADPDPERIFRWAADEAARNAARHGREAETPKVRGDLREKILRLAQSDRTDAAVRSRAAAKDEERRRRYDVLDLLNANGVPPRYRPAAFGDPAAVPAECRDRYGAAARDLASLLDRPGIVALLGTRGSGKTWMGCALVNAFCRHGRHAVYAKASDYFLRIDAAIAAREPVLKVEAQYLRPALLVLDAMEERAETEHKDRMLTRLIDKRYDAMAATVLISNEAESRFAARVGESVADRIRDDGQLIVCDWPSLRGRIG